MDRRTDRRTDFAGRKCSDLGMGGWVSCNLNVVQFVNPYKISLRLFPGRLCQIPLFLRVSGVFFKFSCF